MLAFASGRINIKTHKHRERTRGEYIFMVVLCYWCIPESLSDANLLCRLIISFDESSFSGKGVNNAVRSPSPAEGDERVANCD